MSAETSADEEDAKIVPLLQQYTETKRLDLEEEESLTLRVLSESKKLWGIVGPAIVGRLAAYSMFVVTQAFAGHLGDLELAGMSITISVLTAFDWGLMLGMASALETLCGQAFGGKKYNMMGIYLQRSWIILSITGLFTLPFYVFASPVFKFLGQPDDVAQVSGEVALYLLPVHFSYTLVFPLQTFLQSQLKNYVIATVNVGVFATHLILSWLVVFRSDMGLIGLSVVLSISCWLIVLGLFAHVAGGGCPDSWSGFSFDAFSGLWDFTKLSASSGVMLCLESWYYRILVVMTGNLPNAKIALDALAICMYINGWEIMIPVGFLAGIGVRVANELGAGNGKAAKFATIVAVTQSIAIGFFFWVLIIFFHSQLGFIFTESPPVLEAVHKLSILLAFTVLLNSVQPVLSGVAIGSGWQAYVAYINLGCYYLLGVPLGLTMGWIFNYGVMGMWAGMILGGTAVQTLILATITIRSDWEKEAENANKHVKKWEAKAKVLNTTV